MADRLRLHLPQRHSSASWDPEAALAHALAEKTDFLNHHPQHQEFQKEIDHLLDKAGGAENRMTVLAMLMEGKLIDLHQQLQRLNTILTKSGLKAVPQHFN